MSANGIIDWLKKDYETWKKGADTVRKVTGQKEEKKPDGGDEAMRKYMGAAQTANRKLDQEKAAAKPAPRKKMPRKRG